MAANGADIAAWAKRWVGTPYVWGGNSLSSGIDCSGLVQQVYKHFGVNVSRTTYTQIGEGKGVGMDELQAGDMVFFDTNPSQKGPDHVGIYLGGGKMIHAPRPGKSVEIVDMTSGYYQGIFMGGRRVKGIQGGGNAEPWDPTDTKRLSPEELAASYGWAYGFLKGQSELRKLFDSAVDESWSPDKFQAELRDTKWWKQNSADMRKAAVEKSTDPATYNAKVQAAKIQIQQLAAEMGAAIPASKLNKMADQAVRTNMDEALLKNVLGGYIDFQDNGGTLRGSAGQFEQSIREFAYNMGITLDKQTIKNQAQLIGRGLATEQDFQNQIVNQASSMFPGYKSQLEAGQSMMDIANPYIQQMADDLDIPYTSINLNDPLLKQALNGVNSAGKPTGMDATTFQSVIRNDPRWKRTNKATANVMGVGLQVLKDMGLRS